MKTKPLQKYIFADTLVIFLIWLLFNLHHIFTVQQTWQRQEEEMDIFLPAKYLHRMRDKAMGELALQNTGDGHRLLFVR